MSRRVVVAVELALAGCVLLVLQRDAIYDFSAYVVLDGFDASQWTWLLAVAGVIAAGLAIAKPQLERYATATNLVAGIAIAVAIVATASSAAGPDPEPSRPRFDCADKPSIGCSASRTLDELRGSSQRPSAPPRALLIAALASEILFAAGCAVRRPRA